MKSVKMNYQNLILELSKPHFHIVTFDIFSHSLPYQFGH